MKRAAILGLIFCFLLSELGCAAKSVEGKAIEIALNDQEVKGWLDEGYYEDKIEVTSLGWGFYWDEEVREVRIPIKKRDHWISSAVIVARVDLNKEKVINIAWDVQLVPLTEEEKEEALQIALADPHISEIIAGNQEKYGISYKTSVEVTWGMEEINGGKKRLCASPRVYFDLEVSGYGPWIACIDLDEKRVVDMVGCIVSSLAPR